MNQKDESKQKDENFNNLEKAKIQDSPSNLDKKNKKQKILINELTTKNLILLADMENLRKRLEDEKRNLLKYGSMNLLQSLLPLIDLLEEALKNENVTEETRKWFNGFKMIMNNINQILKDQGVQKIKIKRGETFNHNFHYAIEEKPSNEIEKGKIISIKQNGYTLHNRLINPVYVIISTGAKKEKEEKITKNKKQSNKGEQNV